jgi:multidrug transporter EmrE-like cation transporter
MAWAMVIAASLLEMVWSYSAKRSEGFSRLGWAGLTVITSLASFGLLGFRCVGCHSVRPMLCGQASGQREAFW